MSDNGRITNRQLFALILLDLFAMTAYAYTDWLATLIAALIAACAAWVFAGMARGCALGALPRPLAVLFAAALFVRLAVGAGYRLRLAAGAVGAYMLPRTHGTVVCALLGAVCIYAAAKGIEARARMAELLAPPALLAVVIGLCFAVKGMNIDNLRPALPEAPAVPAALQGFGGVELCAFLYPCASKPAGYRRAAAGAVLCAGVLAAVCMMCAAARFGEGEAARKAFPVIELLDAAAPVTERLSALFTAIWLASAFCAVSGALCFAARLYARLYNGKKRAVIIAGLAAIGFAAAPAGWDGMAALAAPALPLAVWVICKARCAREG